MIMANNLANQIELKIC